MTLPSTFLAARYTEYGEESQVEVVEVPMVSSLPDGHVTVRVKKAALNPIDWMVQAGLLKAAGWAAPEGGLTMGYDFSGEVAAAADDVASSWAVGDAVFGVHWGEGTHHHSKSTALAGTFAQFVTLPASCLSKRPAELKDELAAAIALVGTTAHQALFRNAKVTEGSRVAVLGGAGSVGQLAIQLAKNAGAWVATTASPRNADFVRGLGADQVIDYTKGAWTEALDGKFDAVLDLAGMDGSFAAARGVLKEDGAYVSITNQEAGFDPAAHPPLRFASFFVLSNEPAVQDQLAAAAVAGKLKMPVDSEFPLTTEGVRAAISKQKSGKSVGKIIINVAE